jgi:hypothetical protein
METAEPRRRQKKANASAMTATLPISGGGEMPLLMADAPAPRKRKRKAAAASTEAKPKRRRTPRAAPPPPPPDDAVSVILTLPTLDLRALAAEVAIEVQPKPEVPDFVPSEPVAATFAGARVKVIAIGTRKVTLLHEEPIAQEGDLVLRVSGLFAELSRMRARVIETEADRSVLELTRNAVFATFAIDALKKAGITRPVAAPIAVAPVEAPAIVNEVKTFAPTRALPATFGDARVALLEVSDRTMRVAHSKPLPLDGDHSFAVKTDVADFSGSFARVVTWERLQDGRDVYVSTIEITRSAVSFTCGIDSLISAGVLQARAATDAPAILPIEPDLPPLPDVSVRPLVPVVRIRENRLPKRRTRPPMAAVVAGIVLFIVAVFAYVRRPDDHLRRAQKMIDAYEHGLMATERDYSLPVYAATLRELSQVRNASSSRNDAEQLAKRIRAAIAQHRQREAVKASIAP